MIVQFVTYGEIFYTNTLDGPVPQVGDWVMIGSREFCVESRKFCYNDEPEDPKNRLLVVIHCKSYGIPEYRRKP